MAWGSLRAMSSPISTSTGAKAATEAGVQWTKMPSLASRHQAGTSWRRTRRTAWRSEGIARTLVKRPDNRLPEPATRPSTMTAMSERITRDDVAHVATLAKLELTDTELDEFTHQLAAVLAHAQDVEALDVADVPPTAHPYPLANVLRADVVTAT